MRIKPSLPVGGGLLGEEKICDYNSINKYKHHYTKNKAAGVPVNQDLLALESLVRSRPNQDLHQNPSVMVGC